MRLLPLPPMGFPRKSHSSCRLSTTERPLVSCCLPHVPQATPSLRPTEGYSKISPSRLGSLSTRCFSPPTCGTHVSSWSLLVKRNAVAYVAICTTALVRHLPRCTCRRARSV